MKKEFLTNEQINNLQNKSEQEIYQFLQNASNNILSNKEDEAIFQEVKNQVSNHIASIVKTEVNQILVKLMETNKTIAKRNNEIFMTSFAKLLFEYCQLKKQKSNSINIDVKLFSDMYNYIIGHSFNTQTDKDLIKRLDQFAYSIKDVPEENKKDKYQPDYFKDDLYDAFAGASSIEDIFKLLNKLQS